jgi:signal transduction histidine kinase/ActR/RegA family two-component response regulator
LSTKPTSDRRGSPLEAPIHTLWVRLAVAVGFLLLVAASVGTLLASARNTADERLVGHTLEVRRVAAAVFTEVQAAETAQRGYLLTDDPAYLPPLYRAKRELPGLQSRLGLLTADNPAQRARLAQLERLIASKLARIDATITLERSGRHGDAMLLVRSGVGRDFMVDIRQIADAIDAAEASLLATRTVAAERSGDLETQEIVGAIVLAVLLATIVGVTARRYSISLEALNAELISQIGEREKTEAQLRQAQKMEAMGQLTGGIAHDFNNMLAIIMGNLDLMARRTPGPDEASRRLLDNAREGAQRAAGLTRRLLAFSRLQPLAPAIVDIGNCLEDMSELLRRSLGETIAIQTVIAPNLWLAFVDCPQFESAILNLAVNAKDAMPLGGKLTLEASNTYLNGAYASDHEGIGVGDYVMFALSDDGAGMSNEVLQQAIDPFFTTKPIGAGTGLGLSQVYGFVKQSGGHLSLYSEPGTGTTVKLYLPRAQGSVKRSELAARDEGLMRDRSEVRILVVEDELGVRQFTMAALADLGYGVVSADNAADALDSLDERVALLLTDVVMPHINGRQLAAEAVKRYPELKVVYMTGYTRDAIVHNGMLDPGIRLISKPFTVSDLDREVQAALNAGDGSDVPSGVAPEPTRLGV